MKKIFLEAYNGSYYTIIGCGGNLEEWKEAYTKFLHDSNIGELTENDWIEFSGKDLTEIFELTGDNAYNANLQCLAFSLKNITNITALSIMKVYQNDRWFDDIVDNDLRREHEKNPLKSSNAEYYLK
jgi:hypothetical protein